MNVERLSLRLRNTHFVRLALILICMNLIVYALIHVPQQQKTVSLQNSYSELRRNLTLREKEIQDLHTRLQRLEQSQKDLVYLYDSVLAPKKTGVTDIRLELEALANRLPIQKQGVSYTYKDVKDFGLRQFLLGVPIEGNYRDIRRFINEIERSKYFLILDQVDLSSEQKGERLSMNFRLSTYLKHLPEEDL